VTYDKAGVAGINVGSNKSIIGVGSKGVLRGKGLRMANGAKNGM
jgi:pectin lyase